MANAAQAITELVQHAIGLGERNEKENELHEERIARLETLCFHGNGDSLQVRLRTLVQEIAHVEERRTEALRTAEDRLQRQLDHIVKQYVEGQARMQALTAAHTSGGGILGALVTKWVTGK
jgi:hypothetical protein